MKGCAGDVVPLSSADMPYPSPPPLFNYCFHAVLIAAGEKFLVGDGLRPEDTQDSPEILCVESGEFVEVTLSHPPAFRAVQEGGKYAALIQS